MALTSVRYAEAFPGQVCSHRYSLQNPLLRFVGSIFCLFRASAVTFSVGYAALLLTPEVVC